MIVTVDEVKTHLRIQHDETEIGAAEIVGDREPSLSAPDHYDIVVRVAHAERFCGAMAIDERSAAGSTAFPAAFLSE